MPVPRLPLPDYPWTTAYLALVDVLREDPDLGRVVHTWRTWDGGTKDLETHTPAHMPYVEFMPIPLSIGRATEVEYAVEFKVRVRFAVRGTNVVDLMNLWGAVMQALRFDRPFRNTTVGEYFRSKDAVHHKVVDAGVDPKVIRSADGGDFTSDGVISMLLHIPA